MKPGDAARQRKLSEAELRRIGREHRAAQLEADNSLSAGLAEQARRLTLAGSNFRGEQRPAGRILEDQAATYLDAAYGDRASRSAAEIQADISARIDMVNRDIARAADEHAAILAARYGR